LGQKGYEELRMTAQVMVTLPDDVHQRMMLRAQLTGRAVAEVVAEYVGQPFSELDGNEIEENLKLLSDEQVLQLADSQMPTNLSQRMSYLLEKQQEVQISDDEQAELERLALLGDEGTLIKVCAMGEAMRRGLRNAAS
jgi:hypothetical protein